MATDAYRDMMDCISKTNADWLALMHEVWNPTPYVINVRIKSVRNQIVKWCVGNLGKQSSPIHSQAGRWHLGSASVSGESMIGFASKDDMELFCTAFADYVIKDEPIRQH